MGNSNQDTRPTRTFKVGARTITGLDRVTNRDRSNMRRILSEVRDLSTEPSGAVEFAVITAYTTSVGDGDGWLPVSPDADRDTLRRSFEDWYDNGDVDESTPWYDGLTKPREAEKDADTAKN